MGREFRLLGDPVGHSLSPTICRAAFLAWGIDHTYEVRRVGAEALERAVRDAARAGGGNVTLPHKEAVADLLDEPTAEVADTGACNCFWRTTAGGLAGDNTDVWGFMEVAGSLGEAALGRTLVLGAGGAARAVVVGLRRLGSDSIDVWNRTPGNASRMAAELGGRLTVLDTPPAGGRYDLVVNATRLGLSEEDPLPIDLSPGIADTAFDLVYGPGGTRWTRHAQALGVPVRDGLEMLVHQAARSLVRWFPDREPPIDAMFASVERERGPVHG